MATENILIGWSKYLTKHGIPGPLYETEHEDPATTPQDLYHRLKAVDQFLNGKAGAEKARKCETREAEASEAA